MNRALEKIISGTSLYDVVTGRRQMNELRAWLDKGRPMPPPHLYKQGVVKEYARKFSIRTLVETGTYLGFMVSSTRNTFGRIFSIELDEALFQRALKKFSGSPHISVINGDSGEVLFGLLSRLEEPCLFWLDAHHSSGAAFKTARGKKETPIESELKSILSHKFARSHVILIDDAREFTGSNDYPTLEEVRDLAGRMQPDFSVESIDDIIRIHKKTG